MAATDSPFAGARREPRIWVGSVSRRELHAMIASGRTGAVAAHTRLADLGLDSAGVRELLADVERRWPHLAPLPHQAVADRAVTVSELVDCLVRLDFSTLDLWRTDTWLT